MTHRYLARYADGSSRVMSDGDLLDVPRGVVEVLEIAASGSQARPASVLAREQGSKEGDLK